MSKIVECPNCGMEIEGDEKVCPLCGFEFEETVCEDDEPIEESVPETEPVPKSKAENKSKIMAAVVILVLIIGAIAVFIAIKILNITKSILIFLSLTTIYILVINAKINIINDACSILAPKIAVNINKKYHFLLNSSLNIEFLNGNIVKSKHDTGHK